MSDSCDPEVYKDGVTVFLTNTIRTASMEAWVQEIAKVSGQKVDWHWGCGRAEMLALGDLNRVRKAILQTRHMHDQGYLDALNELPASFRDNEEQSQKQIDGIWRYNQDENGLFRTLCSKCPGECRPQNHAGWDPTK